MRILTSLVRHLWLGLVITLLTTAAFSATSVNFGATCADGTDCNFQKAPEDATVTAKCAIGIMSVTAATYGPRPAKLISCLSYAKASCHGKTSCSLKFTDSSCGGNPGGRKADFGNMNVTCSSSTPAPTPAPAPQPTPVPTPAPPTGSIAFGSKCADGTSCTFSPAVENSSVVAGCTTGAMTVTEALYGAEQSYLSCTSHAASSCNGKSSCTLSFNNANCGGDPIYGVVKSAQMTIACSTTPPTATPTPAPTPVPTPGPAPTPGNTLPVSDLMAALANAKAGDTILLKPGVYDYMTIDSIKFDGEVKIASADPNNRARIQGLIVSTVSNLTFSHLEFDNVHPKSGFAVVIGGMSSNIRFEHSKVHRSSPSESGGMGIFDSTNVTVANSEFYDMQGGIGHRNNTNLTITGNGFHDLQSDAITGGNGTNIAVIGNYFTDFFPIAGHIDMIQFYKFGDTTCRDITVANNVFVRGSGYAIQGIFIGNENKIPYEGVTVTGNILLGAQWHGISVDTADRATLTDNIVQGYADEFSSSWLGIWRSTNVSVSENSATNYNIWGNTNENLGANTSIEAVPLDDTSILAKWLLKHPEMEALVKSEGGNLGNFPGD